MKILAALILSTAIVGSLPSLADEGSDPSVCAPPRCVRETLTFEGFLFNVDVLLPSDYTTSGDQRYPVLYLIHGAEGDETTWLAMSDVEGITAGLPVIVVMPAVTWAGFSLDWDKPSESFLVRGLIPHVDATYRTVPDRGHRAIAGLSGGGAGAMHVAARHPDVFVAAGGFSGNPYDFSIGYFPFTAGFNIFCRAFRGDDPAGVCKGLVGSDVTAPFGDPVTHEVGWHNNNPFDLVTNLRGMSLYLSAGTGLPCDAADVRVLATSGQPLYGLEAWSREEAIRFEQVLSSNGIPHSTNFRPCGIHHWRYWNQALTAFLPQFLAAQGSTDPAPFDYRTTDSTFSVWGWTFAADPDRAEEFLDVTEASTAGLTLTGSGIESVTTAGSFTPGQTVTLAGAVEPSAIADGAGRISFHVDLGPAHDLQQYTLQQRLQEAIQGADYWTSRTVTFP